MKCLFPYKKSFDFYSKRKSLRKIPQKLNLDKALLKQFFIFKRINLRL